MVEIRTLHATEIESVASVLGLARLHQGDGIYLVVWQGIEPLGHAHLALTDPPELQDVQVRQQYRRRGYLDAGLVPQRVKGTVQIRTGPIEVDDTILIWEKRSVP